MEDDIKHLAELMARMHGASTKATASFFVAILGTLVKQGVISAEIVQSQILQGLEDVYRDTAEKNHSEAALAEAEAMALLLEVVRRRLAPE